MQNVWRFQKKPYLCIAFETEVYGRLAQLVQSIWFTPRGSGVRIPQRPQKWKSCEEVREAFFISYRFYTNFLYPFAL